MAERILIVQTGFLGDVVLSTPVIHALSQLYAKAELSFLTTPAARELVCYHRQLKETLVFDKRGKQKGLKGLLNMAKELKSRNYSQVYCLHKSWRTAALVRIAGIPKRYGFSEASGSFLYSATVSRGDKSHEILRNMEILRYANVVPEEFDPTMHIEVPEQALEEVNSICQLTDSRPIVTIAPGSVWATKRWTVAGFTAVARVLVSRGIRVILIGGPQDAEIARHIYERLDGTIDNLVGKCSLVASAAVIKNSQVLLCNDSAPMHIGAAVKTPIVSVWCATVPEFGYQPWGVPHRIFEAKALPCRPCGRHGHNHCPNGTHACQLDISVEDVIDGVLSYVEHSDYSSVLTPSSSMSK